MKTRTRTIPIYWILVAGCAFLGQSAAFAAAPANADPVGSNSIQLVALEKENQECKAWSDSVPESALGAALFSAVLPKVIDIGISSLAAALHKASGEDDKTATSEGLLTVQAYSFNARTETRSWSDAITCLRATSPKGNFEAGFVIRHSSDGAAITIKLAKLKYIGQLKAGRDLVGMTMAVILKGPDGSELANGIFPGPFVLSDSLYNASSSAIKNITTPWMSSPPLNESAKNLFDTRDGLCASRTEAINEYKDAEIAKAKAARKPEPTFSPLDFLSCGTAMIKGVFENTKWTIGRETQLDSLENTLAHHGPVTMQLVVTETRDVNKFLLKVSEALSASKDDIKTALVNNLDPAKKAEARKNEIGLKQDYDIALAQFQEKVRLYDQAVTTSNKAQEKLAAAKAGNDADAIAKAEEVAEKALADRAAAFEAALTARKTARAAALDAEIAVAPDSLLAKYPN